MSATPDYGHVVELADVELLPGECASAPGAGKVRGGLLRVDTRDRSRARRGRRWVRVGKGETTLVRVDEVGKLDGERQACDRTPLVP